MDSDSRMVSKFDAILVNMPLKHEKFVLRRHFNKQQMDILKNGNVPLVLNDIWVCYFENNKLYVHLKETGYCIYIVEFCIDDNHKVAVNKDTEQYDSKSDYDERIRLNKLLDLCVGNSSINEAKNKKSFLLQSDQENIKNMIYIGKNEYNAIFFDSKDKTYDFLNNWYIAKFIVNGIEYSSTGQYILHQKCMLFGDLELANVVISQPNLKIADFKDIYIKGYNAKIWAGIGQLIAIRAIVAKFSQNDHLKQFFLNTHDYYLVDYNVNEGAWSCGLKMSDHERFLLIDGEVRIFMVLL